MKDVMLELLLKVNVIFEVKIIYITILLVPFWKNNG